MCKKERGNLFPLCGSVANGKLHLSDLSLSLSPMYHLHGRPRRRLPSSPAAAAAGIPRASAPADAGEGELASTPLFLFFFSVFRNLLCFPPFQFVKISVFYSSFWRLDSRKKVRFFFIFRADFAVFCSCVRVRLFVIGKVVWNNIHPCVSCFSSWSVRYR